MRVQLARQAHLAILLLLVIIASWPFLVGEGLPVQTDAELHVFRLAELSRLVAGGEIYPRWAPNFYFGYGYPIFNYYAPLAYYLGLPFALLPGVGPVAATKLICILTFFVGAMGAFAFVRQWWGQSAGLVAAAAFLFSPYVQYVDPHARGDLAEFLSIGLFPLALWAQSRLLQHSSPWAFILAVAATALVILSHNLMSLVFFAILLAWTIWQTIIARRRVTTRTGEASDRHRFTNGIVWPYLALALGVGVSAFFWLPVALEQDAVNLRTLIGSGSHFDFRNHFLTLSTLLGPTMWLDWGATEPEFTLNLGMMQWLLAALGTVGVFTGFSRQRDKALFFVVAGAALLFLLTRSSELLWSAIPLMPYLQFPWRLLGPTAFILAVLAGVGVQSLSACLSQLEEKMKSADRGQAGPFRLLQSWTPALALLFILLQSLPLSMVPPWPALQWDTGVGAVTAIERQGRWLGTTSTADFVPATVEALPGPQRPMIDQLLAGGPPDRVNRATLPQGTRVESQTITPLHTRLHVTSGEPFLLRLFLFHFPGWQARIDGQPVETQLGRPEGFLVVPVPAGEHDVDVFFSETPVRRLAWLLSGLALVTAALAAMWISKRRSAQGQPLNRVAGASSRAGLASRAAPLWLAIVLFVILLAFSWQAGLFHYRSQGWTAIPAERDLYADLGGQLSLIGLDAPRQVSRGSNLTVTLYWKAQRNMDINYQAFVHLLDSSNIPVAQSDKLNPGDFPTRRWPTDKYVRDRHHLTIPESLAPGTYLLSTGVWVQNEGWRLPLLDETGTQIGDSVPLLEIEVE